ncbi:MAG: hypothetical protein LBM06_00155 [Prevotellaceae bacterium]|jgi:hypothetical protein|nr:hypothetical protein [Prevotellaceae bacterium]
MNKIVIRITVLIIVAIFISSCVMKQPEFTDFVGTWVTDNGGRIVLMQDSTCIVENLKEPTLPFEPKNSPVSFVGKWKFRMKNDLDYNRPNIVIEQDSLLIYKSFIISGEGLFNNRPPWYFFRYSGDPDLLDEYAFRKVQ